MIFGVLLLATMLVVAGYIVLCYSTQAQGQLQTFGKYLSYWVFLLAAVVIIGSLSAPYFGGRPFGMRMMGEHMGGYGPGTMMGRSMPQMHDGQLAPQPPAATEPPLPEKTEPAKPPSN